MIDIIQEIKVWVAGGKSFALATVIETWRSAPRGVGACMAIDEKGLMIGSVSGGCVEGAVVRSAKEVLASGQPKKLKFGVSNDDAWSVGLSCGGAISVWVQPFFNKTEHGLNCWRAFLKCLEEDRGCVFIYATDVLGFSSATEQLGSLSDLVYQQAEKSIRSKHSTLAIVGGEEYFYHVFPPKNHLLIIGAAHISRDLITLARLHDFAVTVIDPRGLFYESLSDLVGEQRLMRKWPSDVLPAIPLDDAVYAVLLTHDPKIDDQALHILLNSEVAYIGALGSKKTQQKRVNRLLEAGFSQEKIDRIRGPIGLDIGANNPAEIALSIMAEIIKIKNRLSFADEH